MNWDGDLGELTGNKSIVKQGRRAGKSISGTPESPSKDNPPEVRGGWAEDGKKRSRGSSSGIVESEQIEEPTKVDSDDDIPVIPDIDDIQEDLFTLQEMKAPNLSINKATYKELDSNLTGKAPSHKTAADGGDIDFSFLKNEVFKNYINTDVDDSEVWSVESLHDELVKSSS